MATIRYGLLSRGTTVLCDCKLVEGNYESLCQSVLEYVCSDRSKTKYSYETDEHLVQVYSSQQLYYVCVTALVFDRNVAFNCLFELERQLLAEGLKERAQVALPYTLRSNFSRIMGSTLSRYSSSDTLCRLEDRVDEVTDIMRDNIRKVVDRGDTLNDLQDRSEALAFSSQDFRQSSIRLNRKLCLKNMKLWIILIAIVAFIFAIILVIIIIVLAAKGVFNKNS